MKTLPLVLLSVACSRDTTPTWAFDPIWLEPAADDAVHGFQSWQLYGPKWIDNYSEKTYACAVVAELDGDPIACDAEPGCALAWSITPTVIETDCDDPALADDPLFVSLHRLALGSPAEGKDVPWPDQTTIGYADYGNGWEVHGNAYPEALDLGAELPTGDWDGIQPFLWVPTQSFPL
ncbi:MAG: hypothetical protein ABMB14_24265 [Myxococcota bacterium]